MTIQDALMKLLIRQPFYGSLTSVISIHESKTVKRAEMALLPAPLLKYNEEWYIQLPDEQAMGVLIHELLHMLLLHSIRCGSRDPLLWSLCCDMAVNDHIHSDMLPTTAVTTKKIENIIQQKLEPMKSAEYYYEILSTFPGHTFDLMEREGSVLIPGTDGIMMESDIRKEDTTDMVDYAALENKLKYIIDSAAHDGSLPPDLQTEFDITPKRSQLDWKNIFKRFLSGMGRMENHVTYKRDSKRFEGFPGHKRTVGLKVLVALDESGSISDEQLSMFFTELMIINKITNANILVTEFDTECSEPKPASVYYHERKRIKKGGTRFDPIFKLAEDMGIFSVVIFTDGNGNAPKEVNQRVLWILTPNGKKPVDYGYSVYFEE